MNIIKADCDIKKELRSGMNGILSARMREAGMPFRLIFGVELPRLGNIAEEFYGNEELAEHLWSQDIRETKLLAIMIIPPELFTKEKANRWAETMITAEEAQVLAMVLLSKTTHAKKTCLDWLGSASTLPLVSACLCLRHLLNQGVNFSPDERLGMERFIEMKSPEANLHLRKAIHSLKDALIPN